MFSCKFAAYFQNTSSQEHFWMTASDLSSLVTMFFILHGQLLMFVIAVFGIKVKWKSTKVGQTHRSQFHFSFYEVELELFLICSGEFWIVFHRCKSCWIYSHARKYILSTIINFLDIRNFVGTFLESPNRYIGLQDALAIALQN